MPEIQARSTLRSRMAAAVGSLLIAASLGAPIPALATDGAATKLTITRQPVGGVSGAALGTQPIVRIEDAGGNLVDSSTALITVTSTGTLGGSEATGLAASGGVANFTNLTLAGAAGTAYTLTFASSGLRSATSNLIGLIGGLYQGGKVAYILQAGDPGYSATKLQGLIAATGDQSTGTEWAVGQINQTTSVPGGTHTELGTGSANTDSIIAQNGAGSTYAAGLARAYTGGGYSDWYLPSRDELNKLYLNRVAIGGLASDYYYWSSSENLANLAWYQLFVNGVQSDSSKGSTYLVRAVRVFATALVPAKLVFTQQPGGGTAATAWASGNQPWVTVEDAAGNPITDSTASITLAITTGTTGAALTCTANPQTASSGVATFAGCKIDKVGTTYVLTATATDLTSAVSTPAFTVTAGTVDATRSTLTPTSSSITANGTSTQVLTVQAKDAEGNSLTTGGATVLITGPSGTGTGTIGSVTDNNSGTYTATVTSPVSAGSGIFVATLGGAAVKSGGADQTQATVTYTAASSAKAITVFDFNELTPHVVGVITDIDATTGTIALTVPYGTDVSTLVPTITITGTSVSPTSGTANDFTSPATYTVTAADSTSRAYTVTVTGGPTPGGPTVTSVSPAWGPAGGGTLVTFTGTDFTGATAVAFGPTAAVSFTIIDASTGTAVAPGGYGLVHLTVTTQAGTSASTAADVFLFFTLPPVPPNPPQPPVTPVGSPFIPPGAAPFTPAPASTLTLAPAVTVVTWGDPVTLTATLDPASAGRPIGFERSTDDGVTWAPMGTTPTAADGTASLTFDPKQNAQYRASYAGSTDLAAATSTGVSVLVRQTVALRPIVAVDTPLRTRVGATVTFTATVRPIGPGIPLAEVTFVISRKSGSGWTTMSTETVTADAEGFAVLEYRPTAGGTWSVVASAAATATNEASAMSERAIMTVQPNYGAMTLLLLDQ